MMSYIYKPLALWEVARLMIRCPLVRISVVNQCIFLFDKLDEKAGFLSRIFYSRNHGNLMPKDRFFDDNDINSVHAAGT